MTDNSGGGSAALIHLSCFGGFRVTAERPLGAPFLQPGGVAMLAILAARGDAGIAGEELRALAWGNVPDTEGRSALAAALAALWRGGNGDSLLATGDRIAFRPDRVTTDVARFLAACERGDAVDAGEIYEGPYFDGVALDAGAAFDEWLEETRARFNAEYQEVVREARRAARKAADGLVVPDWTAPIELATLPEPTGESAVEAVPFTEATTSAEEPTAPVQEPAMESVERNEPEPGPARSSMRLWLAAAAVVCVVAAVVLSRRSNGDTAAAPLMRGDFAVARAALDRAIAKDSSNGWLWFQLARAADGQGDDLAADSAAARADSLGASLSTERAALVRGYQLWRSGNTPRAVALLDSLVEQQPEFVEATAVLGEVRYRSAPLIGQSQTSARAALDRTVALEPQASGSWRRLLSLALAQRDTGLSEQALAGLRGALGARADTAYGWSRSLWTSDTTPLQQQLARADRASAADLLEQAQLLGVAAGRTTEALTLTEQLLTERQSVADRISAHVIRAALFGAVDDWSRVDLEAARLGRDWPWGGLMIEAAAMLAPSRTVRVAELRSVRDRLMRSTPDTSASAIGHPLLPSSSRTVRFYLLGELAYRMKDARGLQAAVDSLSNPRLGELTLPRTGGSYALSLQALQFLVRGDSAAALGRIEQSAGRAPVTTQQQLWVNGTAERRRRGALLQALGRPGEAAGWLAGVGEFPADLLLGPPVR